MMYLRHRKKKNKRDHAGPIEYFLIFVLIIVFTIALMAQFEPQVSHLFSVIGKYFA